MLSIALDISELAELGKRLGGLDHLDYDDLRWQLAGEMETQARVRIADQKTSADGTPWPAWKNDAYGPKAGGHKLLELSGDLRDLLFAFVDGEHAGAGSNLVYARHQNDGGRDGRGILAREYLGISEGNFDELERIARDWIDQQIADVLS